MGRFIRIVKADKPFKTKQQKKDERKAKRAQQREEREQRKAAKKDKPKAQKEAPEEPPEEPPREAEPQQEEKEFFSQPRVPEKTGNRTLDGFNSLQPYMDAIVREYGGKENVADKFFESIIYANNVLLARTLGLDEEVKIDEDAEDFGLMDEPLINKPIMMHLKGLSKQHAGLEVAQEAYEEKNGISLKELQEGMGGIRDDVSSFIADPQTAGRALSQREINGVAKLFDEVFHPLSPLLAQEIPNSKTILPNVKRARKPRKMVRVMSDANFEQQMNELAREQEERVRGMGDIDEDAPFANILTPQETRTRDMYDKFFSLTDVERGPDTPAAISIQKPKSKNTQSVLDKVRGYEREGMDTKAAFDKVQDDFNQYMISLTGERAFGTAGRAKSFGGAIDIKGAPDAITPSMVEAGKQLKIAVPSANTPDFIAKKFHQYDDDRRRNIKRKRSDPFSRELREQLAEQLGAEENTDGYHVSLLNAMSDNNMGFLSNEYHRDSEMGVGGDASLTGSQEELEAKTSEARRSRFGGDATEAALMTPEDELAYIQGRQQVKMDKDKVDLDRRLSQGEIDEYEYEMLLAGRKLGKFKVDQKAMLGGITGDDFPIDHPLHGLSEENILKKSELFADNLIGLGRLLGEFKNEAFRAHGAESQEERDPLIDEIDALGITGEDLVEFADIENASVEAREKYEKLDKLVTTPRYTVRYDEETKKPKEVEVPYEVGKGRLKTVMPRISKQIGSFQRQMRDMGISNIDLLDAAMAYTNADGGIKGYMEAFETLAKQTRRDGTLDTYPIHALMKHLRGSNYYHAMNDEYQEKVAEQQHRFHDNHNARQNDEEDGLLHDTEECLACHPDRFGNKDAREATVRGSPVGKSPFAHKPVVVPNLKRFSVGGQTGTLPVVGTPDNPNITSLAKIMKHIFPERNIDLQFLANQRQRMLDSPRQSSEKWDRDKAKSYRYAIKQAVMTNNPNAADIYKTFGLYKTTEKPLASGPAGLSNKELMAINTLFPDEDAINKHAESHRRNTIVATRYNGIEDAIAFFEELAEGAYEGAKYKPGAFRNENTRREIINNMAGEQLKGMQKSQATIERRNNSLAVDKPMYDKYLQEKEEVDELVRRTKPSTEVVDGIEREVPAELRTPAQLKIVNERILQMKARYDKMLARRKRHLNDIKKEEKKIESTRNKSDTLLERANARMIGAFIEGGGHIVEMLKEGRDMDSDAIQELYKKMYADADDDYIFIGTPSGQTKKDYTHTLDNYKVGRIGELASTGVTYGKNNKALPRINNINQLIAHRGSMGVPLTTEDIERLEAMMDDAEQNDVNVEDLGFNAFRNDILLPEEIDNLSALEHEHHDDKEDEQGLLSEAEAARREQNSHFTKDYIERQGGEESAIASAKGFPTNEELNWKQGAPTLCGTCHGHQFITQDEAISYLRHHVPELRGLGAHSPKLKRYMEEKMRPPGFGSFAEHPRSDAMDPLDHPHIACPACDHPADYVRGGRISNGICGHCFGSGERDPENDEHIQEGYVDAEGNQITGKAHHYSHTGAVGRKHDFLNTLLNEEMKDIVKYVLPQNLATRRPNVMQLGFGLQSPASGIYQNVVDAGRYATFQQLREQRRKERRLDRSPLKIDPDAPELPSTPTERRKQQPLTFDTPEQEPISFAAPTPQEATAPPNIDIPLLGKHRALIKAHEQKVADNHIRVLEEMAMANQPHMQKQIQEMVQTIKSHPHYPHGMFQYNDVHYARGQKDEDGNTISDDGIVTMIHKLQYIAEQHLVDDLSDAFKFYQQFDEEGKPTGKPGGMMMSNKERKKLLADRRRMPVDENGDINVSVADIFNGNAPMTYGDFEPLSPRHGLFLAQKEIDEGLFEPDATHGPSEPTIRDFKQLFPHNKKVQSLIKRFEDKKKFDTPTVQKIRDSISDIEKPLVARKTTNLEHPELNRMLEMFGRPTMKEEMAFPELTYANETADALKNAGISQEKRDKLLSQVNIKGHREGLNARYSKALNQPIGEMWREFALMKAMRVFLSKVNNPLEYEKIPQELSESNFKDIVGEDAGLYSLLNDVAASMLGFDDADHLSRKLNMKAGKRLIKDPRTGEVLGELSAKDFKARVMENANHEDTASLPMGRVVFNDEGKGQFVVRDVDQMMREGQNIAWSDDDQKQWENLQRIYAWYSAPNWNQMAEHYDVIDGEKSEDGSGFASYDELRHAHENQALSPEVARFIGTGHGLSMMSHPVRRNINLTEHEQYLYAKEQERQAKQQYGGMRGIMQNIPPVARTLPRYPDNVPQQQQQPIDFNQDSQ